MSINKDDNIKTLLEQYKKNEHLFKVFDDLKLSTPHIKDLSESFKYYDTYKEIIKSPIHDYALEISKNFSHYPLKEIQNIISKQTEQFETLNKMIESIPLNVINKYLNNLKSLDEQLKGMQKLTKYFPINMSYEKGVSSIYKDAYKEIPKEATITLEENTEGELQPVVVAPDISYPLENQPLINSLQVFKNISYKNASEFISFLERFPFFASESRIGKNIYEELREKSKELISTIPKDTIFFRGRVRKKDDMDYSFKEMFGPHHQDADIQRFSFYGNSCLYLASSLSVVSKELGRKKYITRISFKNKRKLKVLDFTDKMGVVFTLGMKEKINIEKMPKEYLIPNFISQCCTYLNEYEGTDIDGIRYPSTKDNSGYSLALFSQSMENFRCMEHVLLE